MMRAALSTAAAVALGLVVLAPVAHAGTVEYFQSTSRYYSSTVTYSAALGEHNDVQVAFDSGGVRISDEVPIALRGDCRRETASEVVCPGGVVTINLHDEDDRMRATPGPGVTAYGGTGDDLLAGAEGTGGDQLFGGDGRDVLSGGPGEDRLRGDDGVPYADVLSGGEGHYDRLDYSGRAGPIAIDLSIPESTSGEPDEGDVISGFEHATTGSGDDTLIGNEKPNFLSAGGGSNTIQAAHGADLIDTGGSGGHNRIDAGAGDDRINARVPNFAADEVSCGEGADRAGAAIEDYLASDCEEWTFNFLDRDDGLTGAQPEVRGDIAVFSVPCPFRELGPKPCRARLRLDDAQTGEPAAGPRQVRVRHGRTRRVGLRLYPTAAAAVGSDEGLLVRYRLYLNGRGNHVRRRTEARTGYMLTLRSP
jgi:RTX calcium-binding nonapeptide repeat (4 copies)